MIQSPAGILLPSVNLAPYLKKKIMSETPKYGLYLRLDYRPLEALLVYQHGRFGGVLLKIYYRFQKQP